jgi:3-oxoadipate enol-lactonase
VSNYAVTSSDGTTIAAWCNDGDGIPLLICNGLASSPAAWPSLRDPECGFQARTWYHRGIPPSHVPAGGIEMSDHVADALAVVKDAGWDRYLVVGWSLGVNIALELAAADDRVAGVLALAGLPGGSYDAMLPLPAVPREVATQLVAFSTAVLQAGGSWLTAVATRIGQSPLTADLLKSSGAISSKAQSEHVRDRLASAMRRHEPMDVARISCPVVYVSAGKDFITDPTAVEDAADRTPRGRVERWNGTHFLVVEFPDRVRERLLGLAADVDLQAI